MVKSKNLDSKIFQNKNTKNKIQPEIKEQKSKIELVIDAHFKGIKTLVSNNNFNHIYVLDTNVLMGFPEVIEILAQEGEYANNNGKKSNPNMIIISDIVRMELDGLKKNKITWKADDARIATRGINDYIQKNILVPCEDYNLGFKFSGGSHVVLLAYSDSSKKFPKLREEFGADDKIISTVIALRNYLNGRNKEKITLVSEDNGVNISCNQLNISCEKLGKFYKIADYTGFIKINLDWDKHRELYEKLIKQEMEKIPIKKINEMFPDVDINPNQFISFIGEGINPSKYFRVDPGMVYADSNLRYYRNFINDKKEKIKEIREFNQRKSRHNSKNKKNDSNQRKSRHNSRDDKNDSSRDDKNDSSKPINCYDYLPNPEQVCLIDLLYDPRIDFVTVTGPPGTGKTMIAADVGLLGLFKKNYSSMLLVNPLNNSIGYLPGTKDEKILPENMNVLTQIYKLLGVNKENNLTQNEVHNQVKNLMDNEKINLNCIEYLQGMSLDKTYIHSEESQNIPVGKPMREFATRLGDDSKMVIVGDPKQVINWPRCSDTKNGILYFMTKFKKEKAKNYAHITLSRVERSHGAEQAGELL